MKPLLNKYGLMDRNQCKQKFWQKSYQKSKINQGFVINLSSKSQKMYSWQLTINLYLPVSNSKMAVFRKDPCGFTCLLMTYAAVFYADYVVVRWIVLSTMPDTYWGLFHITVFNVIVIMLFISHSRAVFSDPGIVPLPSNRIDFSDLHSKSKEESSAIQPPDEDWTICTR